MYIDVNKNPLIVSHSQLNPHVFKAQLPEQSPHHLLHPGAPAETVPRSAFLLALLQVRDAVAVIRYLVWLEKNVPQGTVDEFSGAEQLEKFRG